MALPCTNCPKRRDGMRVQVRGELPTQNHLYRLGVACTPTWPGSSFRISQTSKPVSTLYLRIMVGLCLRCFVDRGCFSRTYQLFINGASDMTIPRSLPTKRGANGLGTICRISISSRVAG